MTCHQIWHHAWKNSKERPQPKIERGIQMRRPERELGKPPTEPNEAAEDTPSDGQHINLRIGYCNNRAEPRSDKTFQVPKHSHDGLHWGAASVECSVSGGFFRFLPCVSHLTPFNGGAEEPQNAAEVLEFLRTPADDVGFRHRVERVCSSFEQSPKAPASRSVITASDKEALVFLHGFNCPLDYSLSRLAQLLALGDFPSRIYPFVFSWPSGGPLSYFQGTSA